MVTSVPDAIFDHPRLAKVYDAFDGPRDDLAAYLAIAGELGADRVLDVGCGTGCLAILLAAAGRTVIAADPAAASLEVARAKDGSAAVTWIQADAAGLPPGPDLAGPDLAGPDLAGPDLAGPDLAGPDLAGTDLAGTDLAGTDLAGPDLAGPDLAVMTGNAAQVFLADEDWAQVLQAIRAALRPGGYLVFETRRPARRAWQDWAAEPGPVTLDVPGSGPVERRLQVTAVDLPLVSFRYTYTFLADGTVITSDSTLRFRGREELEQSLAAHGYRVLDVREAPDRPGREFVFITQRT